MPVGYLNGIATAQAQPADPNKDQPWMKQNFLGQAKLSKRNGPMQEGKMYTAASGLNGVYKQGEQGWGLYADQGDPEKLMGQQQFYADKFNQNIPNMANEMQGQAAADINGRMTQGIKNVQQSNSARGLLYGGVNAGQEQRVRAQAAGDLAHAKSNINQGLISAGQNMRSNAISTGVSYQQMQQALNNAIYSNAIAKLNGDSSMTNSLLSSAATIGGIAAFA